MSMSILVYMYSKGGLLYPPLNINDDYSYNTMWWPLMWPVKAFKAYLTSNYNDVVMQSQSNAPREYT